MILSYAFQFICSIAIFFCLFDKAMADAAKNVDKSVIERAEELFNSGDVKATLDLLSQYKPKSDELSKYYLLYARSLRKSDRLYESTEKIRLAYIYANSDEERASILFERAETYHKMGFYYEAANLFKIILKDFDKHIDSQKLSLRLAESLFKTGRLNESLDYCIKAGNDNDALYCKANALHALGKIKDANNLYINLIAEKGWLLKPSQETIYMIGENFRLLGRLPDAKIYLNLVRELPEKYLASISLGKIAMEDGDIDRAIRYFKSVQESSDLKIVRHAKLCLADANIRLGKYEEAVSYLLDIRNNYPFGKDYDNAIVMLSTIYRNNNKIDDAISLLKELIFRKVPDQKALNEVEQVIVYLMDRDREGFLRLWKAISKYLLDPIRSDFLLKVARGIKYDGEIFVNLNKWLLKYGNEESRFYSNILLANFYADLGELESANYHLNLIPKSLYKDSSKMDEIMRIRAKVYLLVGEYKKSADSFMSIRNITQDDLRLFSRIISTIKDKKMVEYYENAVKKLDGPPDAFIRLADIFYEMGRRIEALKYYELVTSLKDTEINDAEKRWAYYRISLLLKDKDSAEAIEKVSKTDGLLGRLAKAGLRESDIQRRYEGLFQ